MDLPELAPDAHKGDAGRVLCLVGSKSFPGAAILVARAAQRAGAGLVSMGCLDPNLLTVLPPAAPEAVLLDLTAYAASVDEPLACEGDVADLFDSRANRRSHAWLAGCGLGENERTRDLVVRLLWSSYAGPLVLDADALNVLKPHPETLLDATAQIVITPHPGEASRLMGRAAPTDEEGRIEFARDLAARTGSVCCLKGRGTVVTDGERVHVNETGNQGLATAGTGDVLAGILVAYLGRHVAAGDSSGKPFESAVAAVHAHGLAGDYAAAMLGAHSLIASDLIAFLPQAQLRVPKNEPGGEPGRLEERSEGP